MQTEWKVADCPDKSYATSHKADDELEDPPPIVNDWRLQEINRPTA